MSYILGVRTGQPERECPYSMYLIQQGLRVLNPNWQARKKRTSKNFQVRKLHISEIAKAPKIAKVIKYDTYDHYLL
jgi:hypothetical protein